MTQPPGPRRIGAPRADASVPSPRASRVVGTDTATVRSLIQEVWVDVRSV